MSLDEKYKVLFVNVMVIMFIDIFTKEILVSFAGGEYIRFLFPVILFTTQGMLMGLTEAVKYHILKKRKAIRVRY